MHDRFPRIVESGDPHYFIHKVAAVWIDDKGFLRFKYEDGCGKQNLMGPFYLSMVNDEVPLAAKELAECGLQSPDEVNYLIAFHCGAFPNGTPVLLLRSLEEVPQEFRK